MIAGEAVRCQPSTLPPNAPGCVSDWPALSWTHAYLRERLGATPVHVALTPDGLGDAVKEHDGQLVFAKPHEALGTRLPLRVSSEGCGKWMPVEYRMCASLPEPPERERDTVSFSIELEGGQFYAQRFRTTLRVLDNGCRQGAFFHMQEWKKLWDFSSHGVDPLELSPGTDPPSFLPSFTISTDGVALLT